MMPRPPRSTPFPTRRSSDLIVTQALADAGHRSIGLCNVAIGFQRRFAARFGVEPEQVELEQVRSEEHTSELQSRRDLVCRLLLEKKKQNDDHLDIFRVVKRS